MLLFLLNAWRVNVSVVLLPLIQWQYSGKQMCLKARSFRCSVSFSCCFGDNNDVLKRSEMRTAFNAVVPPFMSPFLLTDNGQKFCYWLLLICVLINSGDGEAPILMSLLNSPISVPQALQPSDRYWASVLFFHVVFLLLPSRNGVLPPMQIWVIKQYGVNQWSKITLFSFAYLQSNVKW